MIAISLVPYKSLRWSLASFTPDVVPAAIRTPLVLYNRYKRDYLLSTSSILAYEASVADSLYSTLQHASTEIKSPFFLIVHHNVCFHRCSIRWFAGYLWRSPAEVHFFLSDHFIGQFCSLDFHMIVDLPKSLPSFVQHLHSYNWMKFKTHTFVHKQWRVFEARHCPTTPNVFWKTKLQIYTEPRHWLCILLAVVFYFS